MRRLSDEETARLTVWLHSHPGDVENADSWPAAAKRLTVNVGFEVGPTTASRLGKALKLRPKYDNAPPLAKLWDKVERLEAELAALKAEGGGK